MKSKPVLKKVDNISLADQVQAQLMDAIIDGRVVMGQKLNTEELAEQLGVSRMPVREAIRSLEIMGVVESVPYVGSRIVKRTQRDIMEIYSLRKILEPIAAESACLRITPQEIDKLESINDRLRQESQFDKKRIYLLNREFHFTLYKPCDNSLLVEMISVLWNLLAFPKLRYGMLHYNNEETINDMVSEHQYFIELLYQKNAKKLHDVIEYRLGLRVKSVLDELY